MKKRIESFYTDCFYNNLAERRANDWINKNDINVIDIRTSYSFFNGYKCEVIYEK